MAELAANVQSDLTARLHRDGSRPKARAARWRRWLGRAAREPFVHFIVLGGLLFAFNEYLEARANFSRITITRDDVAGIVTNYQLQYGTTPAGEQLQTLVDQYVREQVFYHEALRLGLDKDDEIIRRRLVQKYEFLQQDLGIAREPTQPQLRAYFEAHAAAYQTPAKLTFSHVYFSPDARGDEAARQAAQSLRRDLMAAGAQRAPAQGDAFPGAADYAALTQADVARVFGSSELSEQIFNLPVDQWSLPLRSGLGWHLVYVNALQPAHAARLEEVADAVRRDYLDAERSRHNAESFAKLARGFTIVRE